MDLHVANFVCAIKYTAKCRPSCCMDTCTSSVRNRILNGREKSGILATHLTSHWRDCHFADALSPSLLKHLLKVEGGAAEWQFRRRLHLPERPIHPGRVQLLAHLHTAIGSHVLQSFLSLWVTLTRFGPPLIPQVQTEQAFSAQVLLCAWSKPGLIPGPPCMMMDANCKQVRTPSSSRAPAVSPSVGEAAYNPRVPHDRTLIGHRGAAFRIRRVDQPIQRTMKRRMIVFGRR